MILEHLYQGEPGAWKIVFRASAAELAAALAAVPAQGEEEDRLADAVYGGRHVCAAVARGNVIGTQFHPEKSGPVGLAIIQGYLQLCQTAE